MSRERGCAEGHGVCVDGAFWELGACVGARREGLAGGHIDNSLERCSSVCSGIFVNGFLGWRMGSWPDCAAEEEV